MYHFSTKLSDSMENIEKKVTDALKDEGFGVLTEIDVKATLKKKLDIDKAPYKILGACNPVLANKAIDFEADIGLLLPCNVILREDTDGKIIVGFMDPAAVLTLVKKPEIEELAKDVRGRLMRVRDVLGGEFSD